MKIVESLIQDCKGSDERLKFSAFIQMFDYFNEEDNMELPPFEQFAEIVAVQIESMDSKNKEIAVVAVETMSRLIKLFPDSLDYFMAPIIHKVIYFH